MNNGIDYSKIQLDRKSPEPLHIQLKNALLKAMRSIPSSRKTILMSEREIAQMLKVSRQTVHRTYQELLDQRLVRRRPDKSLVIADDSRNKITGSYRVIGILLPMDFSAFVDLNDRSAIPYMKGIIGRASQQNISCMMLQVPCGEPTVREIDAFLEEHIHRLYGIIHLGTFSAGKSGNAVLSRIMARKEIPQVCISGISEYPHIGSVFADVAPAMLEACRIMLDSGISTLGIVRASLAPENPEFTYVSRFRVDTMREVALKNGIKITADVLADDAEAVKNMLSSPKRPDAVFCHNSLIAEQIIPVIKEMDLRIPEDIAVFGYDLKTSNTDLARIDPHSEKIAAAAVDLICRHFDEGVTPENRIIKIPAGFINGSTLKK